MEIMYQNTIYICISCIAKFVDSRWKNADVSRTQGCVAWFTYFLDLLWVRYNCAKFHYCRIYVTDFREGGPFCTPPPPPIHEQPRKSPSWVGLKLLAILIQGLKGIFPGQVHIFQDTFFENSQIHQLTIISS